MSLWWILDIQAEVGRQVEVRSWEKPGHEDQKIGNDGIYTILKPWNLDEISYRGNVDEKEES